MPLGVAVSRVQDGEAVPCGLWGPVVVRWSHSSLSEFCAFGHVHLVPALTDGNSAVPAHRAAVRGQPSSIPLGSVCDESPLQSRPLGYVTEGNKTRPPSPRGLPCARPMSLGPLANAAAAPTAPKGVMASLVLARGLGKAARVRFQ